MMELPKVKKTREIPRGKTARETFAEIILSVGGEKTTYRGLSTRKKIALVRKLYDTILEGKVSFPDGREILLSYEQWADLVWKIFNHVDVTSVTDIVRENGALQAGALTTNVILYLPTNQRDNLENIQTVFQDEASKKLSELYPEINIRPHLEEEAS